MGKLPNRTKILIRKFGGIMREKLNDWWSNNKPDENLIYKNGLTEQCVFVRDKLMGNLFLYIATDYLKYKKLWDERCKILDDFMPDVIGTHYSKSVLLPVMEMDLSKIGLDSKCFLTLSTAQAQTEMALVGLLSSLSNSSKNPHLYLSGSSKHISST